MRTHQLTIRTNAPSVPWADKLVSDLNAFFAEGNRQFYLQQVIQGPVPKPSTNVKEYGTGAYPCEVWLEEGQPWSGVYFDAEDGGIISRVWLPSVESMRWEAVSQMIIHEFEHGFGAGLGEYYNLEWMPDPTGVEPLCKLDSYTVPLEGYWADEVRTDFMHDPLFRFSDTPRMSTLTRLCCLGDYRLSLPERRVPIENRLRILVVDEDGDTLGARVRVWHVDKGRDWNEGTADLLLDEVGSHVDMPFSDHPFKMYEDRIRLIKIHRDGYVPIAGWVSVFDLQLASLLNEDAVLRVEMRKNPKPQVIPQPRLEITKYNGFATLVARDVVPGVAYELFSAHRIAESFVATTSTQELSVILSASAPHENFQLRTAPPRVQRSAPSMPATPEWSMRPHCHCQKLHGGARR